MTAAELQSYSAELTEETAEVEGRTEQIILRGIVAAAEAFDHMAPLPPMRNHGSDPHDSWEPAARRYRDLTEAEREAAK